MHGELTAQDMGYLAQPETPGEVRAACLSRSDLPAGLLADLTARPCTEIDNAVLTNMGRMPAGLVAASLGRLVNDLDPRQLRRALDSAPNRGALPHLIGLRENPWPVRFEAAAAWLRGDQGEDSDTITALLADYLSAGTPDREAVSPTLDDVWLTATVEQLALLAQVLTQVPLPDFPDLRARIDQEMQARSRPARELVEVLLSTAQHRWAPGTGCVTSQARAVRLWRNLDPQERTVETAARLLMSRNSTHLLVRELEELHPAVTRLVAAWDSLEDETIRDWMYDDHDAVLTLMKKVHPATVTQHVLVTCPDTMVDAVVADYLAAPDGWQGILDGSDLLRTLSNRGRAQEVSRVIPLLPMRDLNWLWDSCTEVADYLAQPWPRPSLRRPTRRCSAWHWTSWRVGPHHSRRSSRPPGPSRNTEPPGRDRERGGGRTPRPPPSVCLTQESCSSPAARSDAVA